MKVRELIAVLEEPDADADVYIMSQPHYPFEYAVAGVTVREECEDREKEEEEGGDAGASDLPRNDVFILEGSQVRYGSKAAWRARR